MKSKTFKKLTAMLLAVMLVLSMCVVSVSAAETGEATYVVAGVTDLCGVGGTGYGWDPADPSNVMTANEDGTYSKVYTDVAVKNDYQVKVTVTDAEGVTTWYGIDGGADNLTFHVVEACDVTITFDPATLKLSATGTGVKIPTGLEIESMRTVGNGDETWLNGANWDTADDANLMTEVAPNVYEITYTGVEEFDNYQVKFAANGSWAVNWGGVYEGSGIVSPAVFNGNDNITVEVPYEVADVTIRLDLTAFDYATKEGATFTITVVDPTEVPTEPETTIPVTEPVTEPIETEPVVEIVDYVVAGVPALCGVGGTGYGWDPADVTNVMTANADGTYSMVYADVAVANDYQFKIVGLDAEGTAYWYGIDGGADNFTFHVIEACDVTITFDPATLKLSATGAGVKIPTGLEIESMRTVGNGDETWLNGANWDPADDANLMTEVAPNVYEITYTGVEEFDNYQVKFAANGSWAVNWGGVYEGSGIASPAVFNGNDNITVEVPYEVADVTIRLDLTAFDYATKEGATFTITVVDPTEVPTEPETEPVTDPVVEIVDYVVAGVPALCGVGGTGYGWDPADVTNAMTANADGTYSMVYTDVAVAKDYQLKIVGIDTEGTAHWWGIDGGDDNVTFHITEVCDVTVTYDPATKKITVEGTGVVIPSGLEIESLRTVGNGDETWLNGANWDPADDANLMTEVAPNVYEITYTGVEEFDNYQVKFAANGSWAVNWGGVYEGSGIASPAVFNGNDNITVEVPYEVADVTIRLDLTNFDYATKEGATFTVTVEDATPASSVSVFGDINLPLEEDGDTYTGSIDLEAGTYKFNVDDNGTTKGFNFTFTDATTISYAAGYKAQTTLIATGGRYEFVYSPTAQLLRVRFKPFSDIVELFGDINVELVRTSSTSTVFTGSARVEPGTYTFRINDQGVQKCFGYTFDDVVFGAQYNASWTAATTFIASGGIYSVQYDTATSKLTFMHAPAGLGEVRVFGDFNLDLARQGDNLFSAQTTLEAGTYQFRVDSFGTTLCNGSKFADTIGKVEYKADWKAASEFTATEKMKFTFIFNSENNTLSVYNAPIDTTKVLVAFEDMNLELTSEDGVNYTATTTLEEGKYSFRMDVFGVTMCCAGTATDKITGATYSSQYKSATNFNATGGEYTFTFNIDTNKLFVSKA